MDDGKCRNGLQDYARKRISGTIRKSWKLVHKSQCNCVIHDDKRKERENSPVRVTHRSYTSVTRYTYVKGIQCTAVYSDSFK
jgi:hypothetical protein